MCLVEYFSSGKNRKWNRLDQKTKVGGKRTRFPPTLFIVEILLFERLSTFIYVVLFLDVVHGSGVRGAPQSLQVSEVTHGVIT